MRQHFNINTITQLLKPDFLEIFKEKVAEPSRLSPTSVFKIELTGVFLAMTPSLNMS